MVCTYEAPLNLSSSTKCFTVCFSFTHSLTHYWWQSCHPSLWPAIQCFPKSLGQQVSWKLEMPGMDPKIRRQPDQTTNSIRKPHSALTIALHKRTANSSVTMLFSTFLPSYLVFDTQLQSKS